MSETAVRLQAHNQEMVKCIGNLRQQRDALAERVDKQLRRKDVLMHEIEGLKQMLAEVNTSIATDTERLHELNSKLEETITGYNKVVDTMQLLLMNVKQPATKDPEKNCPDQS